MNFRLAFERSLNCQVTVPARRSLVGELVTGVFFTSTELIDALFAKRLSTPQRLQTSFLVMLQEIHSSDWKLSRLSRGGVKIAQ